MTPRFVFGALVLVATACSSGGDSASTTDSPPESGAAATTKPSGTPATTTPATTTPATTTPVTTAPAATLTTTDPTVASTTAVPPATTETPDLSAAELADQELARTALITLDSFPTGWTEEPDVDDESSIDVEFEDQFDACLGRDDDDERVGDDLERLAVSTGDFQPAGDEATSVAHEVVMAPDVDTAITAMSEVSVDGAETCVSDVVQRFYTKTFSEDPDLVGITIGEVTVTRTERERPADVATGVLLEIPLGLEGQTVSQYLEVLYQRQGRALSELSFTSLGSPFSRDGYTILSDEAAIGLATIGN